MIKPVHRFLLGLLIPFCYGSPGVSEERLRDVFRVNTKVVLVDLSVKDAKSKAPVRDLGPEHFKGFDNGRRFAGRGRTEGQMLSDSTRD